MALDFLSSWVLLPAQVPAESYLLQGKVEVWRTEAATEEVGGTSQRSVWGSSLFQSLLPSSLILSWEHGIQGEKDRGFRQPSVCGEEIGTQKVLFTC